MAAMDTSIIEKTVEYVKADNFNLVYGKDQVRCTNCNGLSFGTKF